MIEIRETGLADLEKVRALWADGDVMRFVGFPEGLRKTEEEMRGWLRWIEAKRPGRNHYSIFEDGRYCGEAFYDIGQEHRSAALDIKLFAFARGRGLGPAGLSRAIRPENAKAIALYRKLGFRQSDFPAWLLSEGEAPGSVYMELLRDEYESPSSDF